MRMTSTDVRNASRRPSGDALARVILRAIACIGLAATAVCNADAEIFKCKDADGRILYSDSPCPGGSQGEVLVPNDSSPVPAAKSPPPEANRSPAPAAPSDARQPATAASDGRQAADSTSASYELSANERQRIANLEQVQRAADNAEKREAARMEIQEIRRGTVARMSYQDQRRKDDFWVDLGNLDPQRRVVAVRQLADLFAGYR